MKKFFVANWKMNGSQTFIQSFFKEFSRFKVRIDWEEIVFCPPSLYSQNVSSELPSFAKLGAQDCHYQFQGAFTGDISPSMLQEIGCSYVILGHSERRQYHHETSEHVQAKAESALTCHLLPIICVGESREYRESGQAIPFVLNQLQQSLPKGEGDFLVAYEPIWAIGTGRVASIQDIESMHEAIRGFLEKAYGPKGLGVPLLYGGSVTPETGADILAVDNVNGVLVGGASLKPDVFMALIRCQSSQNLRPSV